MLTNTSSVDVHFEVEMCDELADSEQMLQPNWLYVEPQNGDLKKDKPAKFTVMYYSGAPGEFRRKFLIKVSKKSACTNINNCYPSLLVSRD